MLPEEFRRFGHEVVDWIADYLAHPEHYPVLPKMSPGDLVDALPPHGPDKAEPMERILADFEKLIVPASTHWNHPGFMAYFANTSPGPAILGEMLPAEVSERRQFLLASSIIGQILHYRMARPVIALLIGRQVFDTLDVETLTEHITAVSLTAIEHFSQRPAAGEMP